MSEKKTKPKKIRDPLQIRADIEETKRKAHAKLEKLRAELAISDEETKKTASPKFLGISNILNPRKKNANEEKKPQEERR